MKSLGQHKRETITGYLMILPAVSYIAVIAMYPLMRTFVLSLFGMQLQIPNSSKFIGLSNYVAIASDSRFWVAVGHTLYFVFFSVGLELFVGFAMALLMNKQIFGRGIIRASILIPWAIPPSIAAMMWTFMYNDQFGVVSDILQRIGIISSSQPLLGSSSTAMWCAIVSDVWKTSPFVALLILSGLQTIPKELYQAAEVDGAGKIYSLYKITIPIVSPTIIVALIFRTMDALRIFDLIFVMTNGGPGNSTETLSVYAYKILFRNLDFGMGSAVAVTIFVFVFVISLVYIYLLRKRMSAIY